jgi:hypothetical protein
VKEMEEKITEVKLRKYGQISLEAQKEVSKKLESLGKDFDYKGYVKISYADEPTFHTVSVDPIEGVPFDYFNEVMNNTRKAIASEVSSSQYKCLSCGATYVPYRVVELTGRDRETDEPVLITTKVCKVCNSTDLVRMG